MESLGSITFKAGLYQDCYFYCVELAIARRQYNTERFEMLHCRSVSRFLLREHHIQVWSQLHPSHQNNSCVPKVWFLQVTVYFD